MNIKRKGNAGELEILHLFHDNEFFAYRNDQRGRGGHENPDICLLAGGLEYHVEVKRRERLNIWQAIAQAEADAGSRRIPVVVFRRNGGEWYVCMKLTAFMDKIPKRRKGA